MLRFRHSPLERPREHIRLLKLDSGDGKGPLKLSLSIHDLQTAPPYSALSYEWGAPAPAVDIVVNGSLFRVRANLGVLLVVLGRKQIQSHIWADAVSIDQTSIEERNEQVAIMSKIYQQAVTVYGFLGLPPDRSVSDPVYSQRVTAYASELKTLHQTLNSNSRYTTELSGDKLSSLVRDTLQLCRCNYWHRRWIIQELFFAKDAIMLWGSTELPLPDLMQLITRLRSLNPSGSVQESSLQGLTNSIPGQLNSIRESRTSASLYKRSIWDPFDTEQPPSHGLIDLLVRFSRTKCLLGVDKVYSLLAMAKEGKNIAVKYDAQLSGIVGEILKSSPSRSSDLLHSLADRPASRSGFRQFYQWEMDRSGTEFGVTVDFGFSTVEKLTDVGCISSLSKCESRHTVEKIMSVLERNDLQQFGQLLRYKFHYFGKSMGLDRNPGVSIFVTAQGLIGVSRLVAAVGDILLLENYRANHQGDHERLLEFQIEARECMRLIAPDSTLPSELVSWGCLLWSDESWLRNRLGNENANSHNDYDVTAGTKHLDVICPTARKLINIPQGELAELADLQTAIRNVESALLSEASLKQSARTTQPATLAPQQDSINIRDGQARAEELRGRIQQALQFDEQEPLDIRRTHIDDDLIERERPSIGRASKLQGMRSRLSQLGLKGVRARRDKSTNANSN